MSDCYLIHVTDLADYPGNGPWVECERGDAVCTGADYAEFMVFDGHGWSCAACDRAAVAEWDAQQRYLERLAW